MIDDRLERIEKVVKELFSDYGQVKKLRGGFISAREYGLLEKLQAILEEPTEEKCDHVITACYKVYECDCGSTKRRIIEGIRPKPPKESK